jgi:hypothetical protein
MQAVGDLQGEMHGRVVAAVVRVHRHVLDVRSFARNLGCDFRQHAALVSDDEWITMPWPLLIMPMIGSPGIGLQHLAN